MTLREKAQEWLDKYKAGEPCSGLLDTEDKAVIVAVFLNVTDPSKKAEGASEIIKALPTKAELLHESGDSDSYRKKYDKCRAELEKELERNANLEQYIGKLAEAQNVTASTLDQCEKELVDVKAKLNTSELEKRNKELEFQLAGAQNRVLRLEGENSAYRFAIRCNGMSGAEVRP